MFSLNLIIVSNLLQIKSPWSLKTRLDNGEITFIPGVTLSFLKETEQFILDECIEQNGLYVDIKKADLLREFSEKNKLNEESIVRILSGETMQKKSGRTPAVKISKTVYAKYFKAEQSAKDIQEIVEKALEMYFERQNNDE